jgi:hypothetical protein
MFPSKKILYKLNKVDKLFNMQESESVEEDQIVCITRIISEVVWPADMDTFSIKRQQCSLDTSFWIGNFDTISGICSDF